MGRPKEHGEDTRVALLDAAERLIEADGLEALSVRAVADAIGATTRAVYSVFGSKAGLLDGLAERSYELLEEEITALPVTRDAAADLVEASVKVFRPMAVGRPALFRLSFLRVVPDLEVSDRTKDASGRAFTLLVERFERLAAAGLLGGRDPRACAVAFNALCEGMATTELRRNGALGPDPAATWRAAFTALLAGFAVPVAPPRPRRR